MGYDWKVRRYVCCEKRADMLEQWTAGAIRNPDRKHVKAGGKCAYCGGQAREVLSYVSKKQAAAIHDSQAARDRFYLIFRTVNDPDLFEAYRDEIRQAETSTAAEMDLLGLARLGDAAKEVEAAEQEHRYIMSLMPLPGQQMTPVQAIWLQHTARRMSKAIKAHQSAQKLVEDIQTRRKSYQQTPELITDEVDNPDRHEALFDIVDGEDGPEWVQRNATSKAIRNVRNDTFRKMFSAKTIENYHLKTGERLCTLIDIVSGSGGTLWQDGMPAGGGNSDYQDYRAMAALELADVQKRSRNFDAVIVMMEVAHGASIREMASRLFGNTARVRLDEVSALVRTGLEDASVVLGFSHTVRYSRARVKNEVWHNPDPMEDWVDGDWSAAVSPQLRPKKGKGD